MVQRQLLTATIIFILLCGNRLLCQQQSSQESPQGPGSIQRPPEGPPSNQPESGRRHGHHGWGPFNRPPGQFGPQGGPSDQGRNLFAERALMFLLMEAPPAELENQLAGWPRFQQMSDADKTNFRNSLKIYRNNRRQTAMHSATQMGVKVRPEDEEAFIRDFWRGRRKIEETLFREMEPRRRELDGKFREEITAKYGSEKQ